MPKGFFAHPNRPTLARVLVTAGGAGGVAIDAIVDMFHAAGATAKVSSIHVNGWFGEFDKLTGVAHFHADRWGTPIDHSRWVFFGDSANDEPMFQAFEHAVGVANVADFFPRMEHHPNWITKGHGGHGFIEGMERILQAQCLNYTR